MAGNTLKRIGVIMLIIGGSLLLTEPGFANTAGTMAVLIGDLIGGYMDGVKAGRREAFGGEDKNPIK
nr:MAG TPA: hypothetical protein [Caudoviricetes sp.]